MIKPVQLSKVLWFTPSITHKQESDVVSYGQDYATIASLGVSGIAAQRPGSCPAKAAPCNKWTAA